MSHAHCRHGPDDQAAPATGTPAGQARRRLHLLLAAVLVPIVLLTLTGLVLLRPGDGPPQRFPAGLGPQSELVRGELVMREVIRCDDRRSAATPGQTVPELPASGDQGVTAECVTAEVMLRSGPDEGTTVVLEVLSTPLEPFPDRGGIRLAYDPDGEPGQQYAFADVERRSPLLLLLAIFAVAVVGLGRWTGVRALFGLGLSLAVLATFVLPSLIAGQDALLVALVGSAAVMLVVLYVAHGVTVQTSVAVLGTLASLALTAGLAEAFVRATALTGLGSDETGLISATVGGIDLRGLLLAGIVIGSLGVLDDMTVTQSSAVWELHLANPATPSRELYRSGLRIGRDHIASTVNTLVLAYVGASLPLLVVYSLADSALGDVLTSEVVAQEVVRALVGSIGLVAAVPITTALAALTVRIDLAR